MKTFTEENFLSLLPVILTKALTGKNLGRELKHTLNPHGIFNTFTIPIDTPKCIPIFFNQTAFEKV